MDYKDLIRRLRASNRDAIVSSDEAASAIETLLAERDAAQKEAQDLQIQWDMYGGDEGVTVAFQKAEERDAAVGELLAFRTCNTCKNSALNRADANLCPFRIDCNGQYWEWRGPQKGEA